jgi:diguanylate cyclase (GGDEF)-like protein/PAS domain S-box-containing protein
MRLKKMLFQRVTATVVAAFALLLVVRWFFPIELIDLLIPAAARLGLNTPMMLLASGCALFLLTGEDSSTPQQLLFVRILSALIAGLSTLILIEHALSVNLGIDFLRTPVAPTIETPNPGRVAPNTCLAFLFAAISLYLSSLAKHTLLQRRIMVFCTMGVMAIAGAGLIGHFLNLNVLYRLAQYNRMLAPTALGLFGLSIGLWFKLQQLLDPTDQSIAAFERRVTRRAAGILAMVAVSTGVAGFTILASNLEKSTSKSMLDTAIANSNAVAAMMGSRLWLSQTLPERHGVLAAFKLLSKNPNDPAASAALDEIGQTLTTGGTTQVQFFLANGALVSQVGASQVRNAPVRMPLNPAEQIGAVVWKDGFFLQTETVVMIDDQVVGKIQMEQALPAIANFIHEIENNNPLTEILFCGRTANDRICAPSRFYPEPRKIALFKPDGSPNTPRIPADLQKNTLLKYADTRGVPVTVAYAPIQNYGVSLSIKTDVESQIAPLRSQIGLLLLVIFCLVALGALMARLQILPLLARVVYEQTRNKVILANSNDAFIAMDSEGVVTDWNARAESLFFWPAEEAIGNSLAEMIVPESLRSAHSAGVAQFKHSGQGPVLNRQIEVMALRRDGSLIPVELSITGFHDGKSHIANAFVRDVSERKSAAQLLEQKEKFLRAITDAIPAIVGYVDKDQRYQFANASYSVVLGINPAAIYGKTVRDIVGDTAYTLVSPHVNSVLNGKAARFEHSFVVRGMPTFLKMDYKPDFDDRGAVAGFYVMGTDITGSKYAEIALKQSQERLRSVTDSLPALVSYIDVGERYRYVNAYVDTLLGFGPEKLLGKTVRETAGEELYATLSPYLKVCLAGRPVNFEGKMKSRGADVLFEASYVPEFDTHGRVIGLYAMMFDITERKQNELLRAESEERLRLITDNLPVLISYIDAKHNLQFGNATFKTWLGADPAAFIGKPISALIGNESYLQRQAYIDRALAGETVNFELAQSTRGINRILQTEYVPHFNLENKVDGIYALSTDITHLKAIEQELAMLARVDSLTGLPNRRQFDERIDEAIARCQRSDHLVALMFLDIDKFKSINDSLGHAAGDDVLKEFSRRLKNTIRKTDTGARLAGDEFVIIINEFKQPTELSIIAKKILTAVRKPMMIDGRTLYVTTSIGITTLSKMDTFAQPIIARADKALYAAKKAGRDQYAEWSKNMTVAPTIS